MHRESLPGGKQRVTMATMGNSSWPLFSRDLWRHGANGFVISCNTSLSAGCKGHKKSYRLSRLEAVWSECFVVRLGAAAWWRPTWHDPIGSFGICPGEVKLYEFVEWWEWRLQRDWYGYYGTMDLFFIERRPLRKTVHSCPRIAERPHVDFQSGFRCTLRAVNHFVAPLSKGISNEGGIGLSFGVLRRPGPVGPSLTPKQCWNEWL